MKSATLILFYSNSSSFEIWSQCLVEITIQFKKSKIEHKNIENSTFEKSSVLLGTKNGYYAKLSEVCPIFAPVWSAHRVNLIAITAFSKIKEFQIFD